MAANLISISKNARPELKEAVSFLKTIVKVPEMENYKVLGRIIK